MIAIDRDLAHDILDTAIEDWKRPSFRAGLAVSVLSAAMLANTRAKLGVTLFISLLAGGAAEHLYGMVEGACTRAVPAVTPPQLYFHGYGCPGHTMEMPAACCLAESDAPGEV